MFLFLGNSCQKEEIIPLEIENQEVVYTYQATLDENEAVLGGYTPIPTTCNCALNVRANRNTTNISSNFNSDWRVTVQRKNSVGSFLEVIKVGHSGLTYTSSDGQDGGDLGDWENNPFTINKGTILRMSVAGPNTNPGYANTTVYASISCIKASPNPVSQNHTGQGLAPLVFGSITNDCSAVGGF